MSESKNFAALVVSEEEIAQARREYQRNYRKNNPDKVRQWTQNFYKKRALTMRHEIEGMEVRQK